MGADRPTGSEHPVPRRRTRVAKANISQIPAGPLADVFGYVSPGQHWRAPMANVVVNESCFRAQNGSDVYSSPMTDTSKGADGVPLSALSVQHEMQLLRQQLDQQTHQTQAAAAQVHMLRDQLTAESTARMEAQVSETLYFRA